MNDLILDLELPLTVRFGSTRKTLGELADLDVGSVIEFDRASDDPVEVLVNGRVVARGQAVVVHGNYGVRISEVLGSGEQEIPA